MTREEVKNLVEVFYHPPFKTFYINSLDGKSFVRQTGVRLGITTSMNVIENIKEIIETHKGYSACIAEISSKKIAGQFMNTVIRRVVILTSTSLQSLTVIPWIVRLL